VLVGHSYARKVITGVAEKAESNIRAIVFLDAFVPESGPAEGGSRVSEALARGDTVITPPPVTSFKNNSETSAWLEGRLTPMPIAAQIEGLQAAGARERIHKKIFVRSARYQLAIFAGAYAKVRSNPSWITFELDCGHHSMVDMPERVTQILLDAA
jgi:pimeloyl-ACP methyl ester carboxylesterase